jgi:MarR family transcriptional regulator, organic hydroperoxide resistance regulator
MKPVKKEKAVDSVFAESLYFASGAFARAVEKLATECWKNSKLTPSQGILLLHLVDNSYSFPAHISSDLRVNPSTVTRLADQLVAKGLVYRLTRGSLSYLGVTNKGIGLLDSLIESNKVFKVRCVELFGKTRLHKLAMFLNESTDKIMSDQSVQHRQENSDLGN